MVTYSSHLYSRSSHHFIQCKLTLHPGLRLHCVYKKFQPYTSPILPPGGGGGERIGDIEGDESLPKCVILRLLTALFIYLFFLANLSSSIRMYPYVCRMYWFATRMYPYVLLCFSYVTRMYWYVPVYPCVIRMSPVCCISHDRLGV